MHIQFSICYSSVCDQTSSHAAAINTAVGWIGGSGGGILTALAPNLEPLGRLTPPSLQRPSAWPFRPWAGALSARRP
jgi:hypothetical protein